MKTQEELQAEIDAAHDALLCAYPSNRKRQASRLAAAVAAKLIMGEPSPEKGDS